MNGPLFRALIISGHRRLKGDQILTARSITLRRRRIIELATGYMKKPRAETFRAFHATTAEEAGLFGAKFYAASTLSARENLADINTDGLSLGKTRDIETSASAIPITTICSPPRPRSKAG
jgi:hypothetical protein